MLLRWSALVLAVAVGLACALPQFEEEKKRSAEVLSQEPDRRDFSREEASEADEDDNEDDQGEGDEDDDEEEEEEDEDFNGLFRRRRRIPLLVGPLSRRFDYWRQLVDSRPREGAFDRRRRIPYYFPRFGQRYSSAFDQAGKKRTMMKKKRGNPYFFPQRGYNFLGHQGYKRVLPLDRAEKRDLGSAFTSGDMLAFGYDRRRKRDELERLLLSGEVDLDESDDGQGEDKRKKRMGA